MQTCFILWTLCFISFESSVAVFLKTKAFGVALSLSGGVLLFGRCLNPAQAAVQGAGYIHQLHLGSGNLSPLGAGSAWHPDSFAWQNNVKPMISDLSQILL